MTIYRLFKEAPKNLDDVIKWRHHLKICKYFRTTFLKSISYIKQGKESTQWTTLNFHYYVISDTRGQNCWQNSLFLPLNQEKLSRFPPSPNFNVDSSFFWRKMHYVLRTSTLKEGERGQQSTTVVTCSVKLSIWLGKKRAILKVLPTNFVLQCLNPKISKSLKTIFFQDIWSHNFKFWVRNTAETLIYMVSDFRLWYRGRF